jgi:TRAP-type C4-dicarboxylate transport system permease small subunit
MKWIVGLARLSAILAGLILIFVAVLTCFNLLLRNLSDNSFAGVFEVTAMSTGAAIALFMPLAQIRHAHIIVDFFTTKAPEKMNEFLDRMGAFILALTFAMFSWRTGLGALNAFEVHSETQIMGIPDGWVYASMVPPFVLSAVVGLYQTLFGLDGLKEH